MSSKHDSVQSLLDQAVIDGVFPGCAVAYGSAEESFFRFSGRQTYDPQSQVVGKATEYDLASLTKVLSTTTVAMDTWPDPAGLENLKVKDFVPEFVSPDISVANLLLHNSGLPAYDWTLCEADLDAEQARHRILTTIPEDNPDRKTVYSCINFVALQAVLESIRGESLDQALQPIAKRMGSNLAYAATAENDDKNSLKQGAEFRKKCSPVEPVELWRAKLLSHKHFENNAHYTQGFVHDPIAFYLGGVSGNAGLFANIYDVERWAKMWLINPSFFASSWEKWRTRSSRDSTRAFGFDTKSIEGSSAGSLFGPNSFGHLGFTGTSLWIDPDNQIFAILLSNRVHPTAENLKISTFRPLFHDQVFSVLKKCKNC